MNCYYDIDQLTSAPGSVTFPAEIQGQHTPALALNGKENFEKAERELNLHPSTVQYTHRIMTMSRFWSSGTTFLCNTALSHNLPPFGHYDPHVHHSY